MKAAQFLVAAFPKLDQEKELQRLREKYNAWLDANQPHIIVIQPFTPATLDEIQSTTEFISQARRRLHPLALSFRQCVEQGSYLVLNVEEGRDELLNLHRDIMGSEPLSLIKEGSSYQPVLVIGRISDPIERGRALAEANRLGRTLGILDALTLVKVEPDSHWHLAARFPFGIGRVDFYERLLGR